MSEEEIKVGDLISYCPYYDDGDASWVMTGDLGIVVKVVNVSKDDNYKVCKVQWLKGGFDHIDVASDVVMKVTKQFLKEEKK